MAFVHGPGLAGGATRLGDYDSLEGLFSFAARPKAPALPTPRNGSPAGLSKSGGGIGATIARARAAAPARTGTALTLTAPQLQPTNAGDTMRVLVAAPTSPVIRRAFRALSDNDRATVIRGLSQSTGLAGYELEQFSDDDLAGLSFKSIGHAFSNVGKAVGKAVTQTGHVVGNAVTSKIGQAVIGTGLALTGVGLPAAAAIGAAAQAGGGLIKSGGGLKAATSGALTGAAEGVAASLAGKAISKYAPSVTNTARDVANAILPGNPFSRIATSTAAATGTPAITDASTLAIAAGGAAALPVTLTPSAPPAIAVAPPLTTTSMTTALPPGGVAVRADTTQRLATGTLAAGAAANRKAKAAAKQVDSLNTKIRALNKALDAAKQAGNTLGISQISSAIADAQGALTVASNVAGAGSDTLRTAGNAIQGATTGAVGGAGFGALGDWVGQHKALAIGAGVATLGIVAIALSPRRSASAGGPWTYDPRTRGIA